MLGMLISSLCHIFQPDPQRAGSEACPLELSLLLLGSGKLAACVCSLGCVCMGGGIVPWQEGCIYPQCFHAQEVVCLAGKAAPRLGRAGTP